MATLRVIYDAAVESSYSFSLQEGFEPAYWSASITAWNELISQVQQDPALMKEFGDREIFFNKLGSVLYLFPEPYLPADLARRVMGGAIWIDWCGQAMEVVARKWFGGFGPVALSFWGDSGFNAFLKESGTHLNYPGKGLPTFRVGRAFSYPRSLAVAQDLTRMPGAFVNESAPRLQTTVAGGEQLFIYSNFALKMGQGYYFYGYGAKPLLGRTAMGAPPGIGAMTYYNFLRSVLLPTVPPGPAPPTPGDGAKVGPSLRQILAVGLIAGGVRLGIDYLSDLRKRR